MSAWLLRRLPELLWIRSLISVLLIAVVILVLMEYVFPWANQFVPWTDSTIGMVLPR